MVFYSFAPAELFFCTFTAVGKSDAGLIAYQISQFSSLPSGLRMVRVEGGVREVRRPFPPQERMKERRSFFAYQQNLLITKSLRMRNQNRSSSLVVDLP